MASIVILFGADQQHGGDLSTPEGRPRFQPDCGWTVSFNFFLCCGSGFGSVGSVCVWSSRIPKSQKRIRLLPSSSKNSKKNLDFYCWPLNEFLPLFRIRIRIRKTRMFLGLPNPDPLDRGTNLRIRIRIPTKIWRIHNTVFYTSFPLIMSLSHESRQLAPL